MAESHSQQAEELARPQRASRWCSPNSSSHAASPTPDEAFAFLNPELSHLHDPFLMLGMTAAVERLEAAIARHEPVLLYGDYDVDGTTAVVLLKTAIEMLGGICSLPRPPPSPRRLWTAILGA